MARKQIHPALRIAVPLVSASLLTILLALGTLNPSPPEGVGVYFETVARTIDKVPYRVGKWIGRDLNAAPPQVLETLRPTRVLHRGYTASQDRFRVVIVHCADVRDMQGHYPARCYPATGWSQVGRHQTISARFAGGQHDVSVYRFDQLGEFGEHIRMTVAVFFALPTTGKPEPAQAIYADLDGVRNASANRRRNLLGSAQFQIIFDGDASNEDVIRVLEQFAPALDPVIETVAEGLS
ncbi:MAG: hypothetical protein COB69_01560 [Phycisphaera sp.]|nr:MAG: hypothetical protein COB69_01560 [Phycisphaera sp.]